MASVLLVDDDEADLLLLKSMLESEHELHLATNGEEALKVYLANSVDVVVTDIQMPHGDGIELITALKGFDAKVAIVAISGQKPHKLGIAQMAGARQILTKPVTPQRLLEAVSLAVQARNEAQPGGD